MKYYPVSDERFEIRGLKHLDFAKGEFYRLPLNIIDKVNDNVTQLAKETAGGRVRFRSNTTKLFIHYKVKDGTGSMSMSGLANSFISVYIDGEYDGMMPDDAMKNEEYFEYRCTERLDGKWHDYTVYLPVHDRLLSMEIGVEEGASFEKPKPYRYEDPVVFYGSSITQGLEASHSGRSYADQLSRMLDFDYLNLGFSGSAFGEDSIAEYIASLKMSAFILDYDHNAPSVEHLKETHERFYKTVREKNPELPVLLLSRPNFRKWRKADHERREIIRNTYINAVNNGDRNVRFIDGESMFGYDSSRYECTVDGTHPNDLGMNKMAETIAPVLREMLEK